MNLKIDDDHNSGENEHFAPEYRDRLRTWLEKMINSGKIPGLCWENKEQTVFRMPWKHAGRQDYNLEEDSKIFMAWAVHSGRYREGVDKPEPIVWKTRLRCALNKMPDIRELPERSRLDISEPYRVYQLLPPVHKASQIRRRLYKRSQSHETENIKDFSEHNRVTSLVNSPIKNDDDWAGKIVDRRNSSIETSRINVTNQQTSPLTSIATASSTPAFWFPSSANLPLKSSMSTTLNSGIHMPQPLNLDPTSALQSLSHSRYPLLPPLHNPFGNFPPSTISPFFTATPNLDTFKRLGFLDQSFFARQRYQEQLTSFAKKFEEKHISTDGSSIPSVELKTNKFQLKKINSISDESHSNFSTIPEEIDLVQQDSRAIKNVPTYHNSLDIYSLRQELSNCQQKIESLGKSLEISEKALEKERNARKQLEEEREGMKLTLERMGDNLRTLAVHIQPSDEEILKGFPKEIFSCEKNKIQRLDVKPSKLSDLKLQSTWKQDTDSLPTRLATTNSTHRQSAFVTVQSTERNTHASQENKIVKRSSSPLDLTVSSPSKKLRHSFDNGDGRSRYPFKYSPRHPDVNSSFITSLADRNTSNEEKRSMTSPSSVSSCSPDSVSIRNAREDQPAYDKLASSPIQHSLQTFPQRHNTIQVT